MKTLVALSFLLIGCATRPAIKPTLSDQQQFIQLAEKIQFMKLSPNNKEFIVILKAINNRAFYGEPVKLAIVVLVSSGTESMNRLMWDTYAQIVINSYDLNPKFKIPVFVLDRQDMGIVLAEQKLDSTGVIDTPFNDPQLSSATHLLIAKIDHVDDLTLESVKLIEKQTGQVLATLSRSH